MRELPGLDASKTELAVRLYNMKMENNELSVEERLNSIRLIFSSLFEELDGDQIEEILGELPGICKPIEEFIDEEMEQRLEALDAPFTELSKARTWRWVSPAWNHNDLEIWRRLVNPDRNKNGDLKWKPPIPNTSMGDLLYNSLRIVDGLSQPDKWDEDGNRTGLVLGNIQSGKTASMLGVSSIVLDEKIGYKILIVLGGHTENLRRQTQTRFEIFKKTQRRNIRFGTTEDSDLPNLTKRPRATELRTKVTNAMQILEDGVPMIWIVKKNPATLAGMKAIMEGLRDNGHDYPTLILDDESDHSSLNNKRNDTEGSTIHRMICELRDSIPRNNYVGYTATPQGILLADPESGLFPKDLLWLLEPHDKYIGADHFFNQLSELIISTIHKDEYPNYGDEEIEVDMEREDAPRMKQRQRRVLKEWKKNGPPVSVKGALVDFVLTGGVRWRRSDFSNKPPPLSCTNVPCGERDGRSGYTRRGNRRRVG